MLTALALACGSALAAQSATGTDRHASRNRDRAAVISSGTQTQPASGTVEKTPSGMHRRADKMRSTGDRVSNKISKTNVRYGEAARNTRAMGATDSTSDPQRGNRNRQARMEDAHDTWKSKQK